MKKDDLRKMIALKPETYWKLREYAFRARQKIGATAEAIIERHCDRANGKKGK